MAGQHPCPVRTSVICMLVLASCCMLGGSSSSSSSAAIAATQPEGGACDAVHGSRADAKAGTCRQHAALREILVVGSINLDITYEVGRLPRRGETITASSPRTAVAVGGKGANQAVAAARVSAAAPAAFVCQFGNDMYAAMLESALVDEHVDVSGCGRSADLPSGQGFVMLESDGAVSSVVVGGSNTEWPASSVEALQERARSAAIVLLQREIPEQVNEAAAEAAFAAGVPVIQDVGGEDRPISNRLLSLLTYVCPNESELSRLTGLPTGSEALLVEAAKSLQARGARNVLVTLGERGSLLVTHDGQVLRQASCPIPGGAVLDATGAGDSFRAAFAVSLVEGRRTLRQSLQFASAAGAIAASRLGAVPSLPSRAEIEALLEQWRPAEEEPTLGSGSGSGSESATAEALQPPSATPSMPTVPAQPPSTATPPTSTTDFPYLFASRLNSMKERPELWRGNVPLSDVFGLLARQGTVRGLQLVDFNFPQHLEGQSPDAVRTALAGAGLRTGAVCIRFPAEMRLGAFTNPDAELRRQAVELTIQGCQWARDLGAGELIVWSAYDGYDYPFQIDYEAAWQRVVEAYQQVCDACPDLRVSIEFKPTDEASRFSVVPSTGAALLLAQQVSRPNFGLTLDLGHMFMAGENPAQSVAMVGSAGKLFGLQLGDGYGRLGAEDGLMFGAANPRAALELVYQLQRVQYKGHVYFDTFPRNEDPVREAEHNVRVFRRLWGTAQALKERGMEGLLASHDAMGAMEMLLDVM